MRFRSRKVDGLGAMQHKSLARRGFSEHKRNSDGVLPRDDNKLLRRGFSEHKRNSDGVLPRDDIKLLRRGFFEQKQNSDGVLPRDDNKLWRRTARFFSRAAVAVVVVVVVVPAPRGDFFKQVETLCVSRPPMQHSSPNIAKPGVVYRRVYQDTTRNTNFQL